MLWLLFAISAALLWATVTIIDKHVVSDELKDPFLCATVFGFGLFIILSLFSLFFIEFTLPLKVIALALGIGFLYIGGIFLYYRALQVEEASRVAPILSLTALWVFALAVLFLKESFSALQLLGIFLLILGAVIISLKISVKYKISSDLFIAGLAAIFFGSRDFLLKLLTSLASLLSFLFFIGLGALITASIILLIHHPHIKKKAKLGIEHLVLNSFLSSIALIFYFFAVSLHSVAIVAALLGLIPLFVFILASWLSKFHSKIILEKLTKPNLILKLVGILTILLGTILVSLF